MGVSRKWFPTPRAVTAAQIPMASSPFSLCSLCKVLAHHLGAFHELRWWLYNPHELRACG